VDAVGLVQVAQILVEPRRNNFSPGAGDDGSVSHFHVGLVREFDPDGDNLVARLVVHYTCDTPPILFQKEQSGEKDIGDLGLWALLLVLCQGKSETVKFH